MEIPLKVACPRHLGAFNKMMKNNQQYWSVGLQISKNECAWTCYHFPHLNKTLEESVSHSGLASLIVLLSELFRTILWNKGWKDSFHLLSLLLSPSLHLTELPQERFNLRAILEDLAAIASKLNGKRISGRKSFSIWKSNIVLFGWEDDSQINWRHLDGTVLFKIERRGLWWKKSTVYGRIYKMDREAVCYCVLHSTGDNLPRLCDDTGGTEANAAMNLKALGTPRLQVIYFALVHVIQVVLHLWPVA